MTTTLPVTTAAPLAAPCAFCGAYSLPGFAAHSALFALSDLLVLKALEVVGKRIVRVSRTRYNLREGRPWHESHALWRPDGPMMDKGLENAWDLVPVLIDSQGLSATVAPTVVVNMLDRYTRDLLMAGQPHSVRLLRARFEKVLGITIPWEGVTPNGAGRTHAR